MTDPKFQDLSDQLEQLETRVANLQDKLVRTVNGGEAIRERLVEVLREELIHQRACVASFTHTIDYERIVEALLAELRRPIKDL